MRRDTSLGYIMEKAAKPAARWSNREIVVFHIQNPNGLLARERKANDRIVALVDAGACKGGANYAFGWFSGFHRNALHELPHRPDSVELKVTLEMLEEKIRKAEAFIAEVEQQAEEATQ